MQRILEAGSLSAWAHEVGAFKINLSVPLVLEYELALSRDPEIDAELIEPVLSYLWKVARHREIYFLWRPFLRDPADELVLEVAAGSGAEAIVTHNGRDFEGVEEAFRIRVETRARSSWASTRGAERHEHAESSVARLAA